MHRLLRNVCLILCWLMAVSVSAQRIISGTVFDENKEPLTGATVSVKEKVTLGTTTDTQGKYMLKLPDNREYTLQVSYMGYISQTHKVSVSKTGKVDFILKEDAVNMETVVVTGTRTPKLLKDVPIVTRVITADEIKNRRTAAQILGNPHAPRAFFHIAGFGDAQRPRPDRRCLETPFLRAFPPQSPDLASVLP